MYLALYYTIPQVQSKKMANFASVNYGVSRNAIFEHRINNLAALYYTIPQVQSKKMANFASVNY